MAQAKRKTVEDELREKLQRMEAWIVDLEKTVGNLREEVLMVSAVAGVTRKAFEDVAQHFEGHPTLKGHLPDLSDLDKLTSGLSNRAGACFEAIKLLHVTIVSASPKTPHS